MVKSILKKRGLFYLKFLNRNVHSETVCQLAYNVKNNRSLPMRLVDSANGGY